MALATFDAFSGCWGIAVAKKPTDLLSEVQSRVVPHYHGLKPWHMRLSPEHAAEIARLHAAYHAGELKLPLRTAARLISSVLQERGISSVGSQGVESWLRKKPD